MLKNLILSAAAAGVAAGLFTAVVQHVTTTPIIIEAEKYEGGAAAHDHGAGAPAHDHGAAAADAPRHVDAWPSRCAEEEEWAPADGIERTLYTSLATTVIGVGFGLVLLGAMSLAGVRIDAAHGPRLRRRRVHRGGARSGARAAAGNSRKRRGGARRRGRPGGSSPSPRRRSASPGLLLTQNVVAADRRRRADRAAAHRRRAASA